MDLELAIKKLSLRTGLSHKCIRELLEKDWVFTESIHEPNRWEKPWPVLRVKSEKH